LKQTSQIQIQRIVFLLTLLVLFLCLEEASGWPWSKKGDSIPFPEAAEELYPALVEMSEQRYDTAMEGFWAFMAERDTHEDGVALAQLSTAACAMELGLKQLATEYYADIVRSSMDRAVTLQALEGLRKITHEEVYDERTIVEELLYEKEFGTLPPELNNFVHYYQALMDFRNGYPRWASNHVAKIEGKDEYFYRAMILEALWALKEDKVGECRGLLEAVAGEPGVETPVRNDAKKALARVMYEQGEFMDAYRLYREIEAPEHTLADVILEEAWAKFRERDYKKSMGLLVAFTAPSFQRLFKPEQYLLQTLIYMQYCHYTAAQGALGAFQDRYGDVLHCIRQRENLTENPQANRILTGLPPVQRVDAYLEELADENATLGELMLSEGFLEYVRPMYELKTAQVERRREKVWNREVERLKRILFDYQEQANLLAYESGMHQYKKVKEMYYSASLEDEGKAKDVVVPQFSRSTYFEFEGEFWSDELDDYTFLIEDYCDMPEKWLGGEVPERDRMAMKDWAKEQKAAEKEEEKRARAAEKEKTKQDKAAQQEKAKKEKAAEKERARQEREEAKQEQAARDEAAEKERAEQEQIRQQEAVEKERAKQEKAARKEQEKKEKAVEQEKARQERAAWKAQAEKEEVAKQAEAKDERAAKQGGKAKQGKVARNDPLE